MNISIKIIESSSSGNCIVLDDGDKLLFLDFGTKAKNIISFLGKNKKEIDNIAAILLTHEHIDHAQSLDNQISFDLNVYSSKGTFYVLDKKIKNIHFKKNIIKNYDEYVDIENSNWSFKIIKTIHNANEPLAFIIKNGENKILYLTDTEYFNLKEFNNMSCYIIETNYGSYVIETKAKESKHIKHIKHHMNSFDVEQYLINNPGPNTKLFLMSHVSNKSDGNYEILDFIKKRYSNEKMKVEYINPKIINNQEFEI